MKNRSPIAVFFLSLITLGIYAIVWQVKTKNEMKSLGADIPTAWLLIVPFVNYYWLWKYSEGVEKTTNGETSAVLAFVLLFLLGVIGMAILQNEYNKIAGQPALAGAPGGVPAGPADPNGFAAPAPTPFAAAPPEPASLPQQPVVNPEPPIGGPQSPTVGAGPDQPLPPQSPPQNPPLV